MASIKAFSVSKKNFEEVFRDPKIPGGFFWFSNLPQQAAENEKHLLI